MQNFQVFCICGYFFLLYIQTESTLDMYTYNYTDANLKCKTRGGLRSNVDFVNGNGVIALEEEHIKTLGLRDGESAWLSGYVEFSKFLSWHGCYEINMKAVINTNVSPEHTNFSRCLDYCNLYANIDIVYVGIRYKYCYCITQDDITQQKIVTIRRDACPNQDPYNFNRYIFEHFQTETGAISVFRIHNNLQWDPLTPALRQCVNTRSVATTLRYATASCYTTEDNTGGYICVNSKLNNTCEDFSDSSEGFPAFCIQRGDTTWLHARKTCRKFSGKLVAEPFPEMRADMENGKKYWTGIFRSFKIVENTSRVNNVETACLAVKMVENKLVLDPDDCSSMKKYICSHWPNPSIGTTMTANTKTPSNEGIANDIVYIIVAVLVVLVAVIVMVLLVMHFRKRTKHTRLRENFSVSLTNDENIVTAATHTEYAVSENDYVEAYSTDNSAKIKPKKPIRQTLKKQHLETSYENFKLTSHRPDDLDNAEKNKNKDTDYDRVDLKSPKTRLLDDNDTDESHIYDHTAVEAESENYDTMKSTKVKMQVDSETYNTLQRKSEEDIEEEMEANKEQNAFETTEEYESANDVLGQLITTEQTVVGISDKEDTYSAPMNENV